MMNHFVPQHNSYATLEDVNIDQKGTTTTFFCPKPISTRKLRWNFFQQNEEYDSSSPPPYLIGSPPVRASNPLMKDEQFGCEEQILQSTSPSGTSSPSSPFRKGGCVRMKFGVNSAAKVRVVGFESHLPAVAY
ncbi:hypothetical protein TSUD_20670 [Trifolium subterraneum]|uniref:Uncharacterized protein n=1 Tax=Trifolium subterraneum TaxID=3900 RepID=A0A2Z6NDC1_TRISU|nr:hypothetical protein TSUD_20670 [Trifolium subterraneum]